MRPDALCWPAMALTMGVRVAALAIAIASACGEGGGGEPDETSGTGAATDPGTSTQSGSTASTTTAGTTTTASDTTVDPGDTTIEPTTTPENCDDGTGDLDFEGGESTGSAEDTNGAMSGDIPIGATVFAVRQGDFDSGTLVEIEDLVVTSPVAQIELDDHVFLQAEEGGDYSGIIVVSYGAEDLAIGTRVRVVGRVARQDALVRIVISGGDEQIIAEGQTTVPDPVVLTLADLGDPDVDLDAYDAAIVRVELPQVTNDAACPGEFALAAELRVDDLFLGDAAPSPAAGTSYTAILGPLRSTSTGYEIAPRSLDDLIE